MKHSVSLGVLASLVAVSLLAQPIIAEPAAPSPVGEWTFGTDKMNEGCTLSGAMTVTRKSDKTLACAFTATWACELRVPRKVHTEQTCTAKQSGSDVVVTSKLTKVARVEPAELFEFMKANYAADHFRVKINTRGDEMKGLFHSYGQAPVIFRKKLELIG